MEGVLSLHEILHGTKVRKKGGLILKLDFEKAYDKLNWEFLLDCITQRGFPEKCCSWIKAVLTGGTLSVNANVRGQEPALVQVQAPAPAWITYQRRGRRSSG